MTAADMDIAIVDGDVSAGAVLASSLGSFCPVAHTASWGVLV